MKPHIDTRGPWPSLIQGQVMARLEGAKTTITIDEAINLLIKGRSLPFSPSKPSYEV